MTEELNLEPLEKACEQLAKGLEKIQSNLEDELWRDGVIQRFEYTMELAWKTIERYLKKIVQVDESNLRSKKDLFREAEKLKIITDAEKWFGHYEARNETSHTYNPDTAKTVFERAEMFLPDARKLLEALRDAN